MTTLEKMIKLSEEIVSLSAQREEAERLRTRSLAARDANASVAADWTIEQFRRRRRLVPAGNGDHRFHTAHPNGS